MTRTRAPFAVLVLLLAGCSASDSAVNGESSLPASKSHHAVVQEAKKFKTLADMGVSKFELETQGIRVRDAIASFLSESNASETARQAALGLPGALQQYAVSAKSLHMSRDPQYAKYDADAARRLQESSEKVRVQQASAIDELLAQLRA